MPQRAVQQGAKGHFVWTVGPEDKVGQRPVTVGEWLGEDWFIFDGLKNGERVAVDGTLTLQPGMAVSVKTPEQAGAPPEARRTTDDQ